MHHRKEHQTMDTMTGAVFVQTNDAASNQAVAFRRGEDGSLSHLGAYETGGRGNGVPHLPSQGSLVVAGGHLLVTNAGSDDLSVFTIGPDALTLVDRAPAGVSPRSVAAHGGLVYVLGTAGITGLRLGMDGKLAAIADSTRPLSAAEADGAQIAFSPDGRTVVVTERVTDRISTYAVEEDGLLDGPVPHPSAGVTPYGFAFGQNGVLVVTEAFGGQVGAAAASSYHLNGAPEIVPVSASIQSTRSEVCWAVVSKAGLYAYVTNFGDNTISSYHIGDDGSLELLDAVAASTRKGEKGLRDETLTADGRFLYALDADSQTIHGWTVHADGELVLAGTADGLPATVAGLAAI
jgi:6-phosphogluconolactonase